MKILLILTFLSGLSVDLMAQEQIFKKFEFGDTTMTRKLPFTVSQGVPIVRFRAEGFIKDGELSFEIKDPEGRTVGNFTLTSATDGEKKPGRGIMTHEVKHPLQGTWVIRLKTSKATGNILYYIYFN